jgi:hypothetical protein
VVPSQPFPLQLSTVTVSHDPADEHIPATMVPPGLHILGMQAVPAFPTQLPL